MTATDCTCHGLLPRPDACDCLAGGNLVAFAKRGAPSLMAGAPPLAPRRGGWMQTYTGKQYWPADPRADDVDIRDIAHALSMQCRYGGHTKGFYSVAEHCVLMATSAVCPDDLRLQTLMHDASEAYLVDVPRPVKGELRGYLEIEAANMVAIGEALGIAWRDYRIVKTLDERILNDERDQAMVTPPANWNLRESQPLGVTLQFWTPHQARSEFLDAFKSFR